MDKSLLGEFRLDWLLAGKAEQTANNYVSGLTLLLERFPALSLSEKYLYSQFLEMLYFIANEWNTTYSECEGMSYGR